MRFVSLFLLFLSLFSLYGNIDVSLNTECYLSYNNYDDDYNTDWIVGNEFLGDKIYTVNSSLDLYPFFSSHSFSLYDRELYLQDLYFTWYGDMVLLILGHIDFQWGKGYFFNPVYFLENNNELSNFSTTMNQNYYWGSDFQYSINNTVLNLYSMFDTDDYSFNSVYMSINNYQDSMELNLGLGYTANKEFYINGEGEVDIGYNFISSLSSSHKISDKKYSNKSVINIQYTSEGGIFSVLEYYLYYNDGFKHNTGFILGYTNKKHPVSVNYNQILSLPNNEYIGVFSIEYATRYLSNILKITYLGSEDNPVEMNITMQCSLLLE